MQRKKYHSLEKRAEHMKTEGKTCDLCGVKPPEVEYRGLCLCNDCLNPDYDAVHLKLTKHYWCGLKSNFGDF